MSVALGLCWGVAWGKFLGGMVFGCCCYCGLEMGCFFLRCDVPVGRCGDEFVFVLY